MSELRAGLISNETGDGPVNLNGQGASKFWMYGDVAAVISESFNVSSSSDLGTGNYTYNFTNAMDTITFTSTISSITTATIICMTNQSLTTEINYRLSNVTPVAFDRAHNAHGLGDLA